MVHTRISIFLNANSRVFQSFANNNQNSSWMQSVFSEPDILFQKTLYHGLFWKNV